MGELGLRVLCWTRSITTYLHERSAEKGSLNGPSLSFPNAYHIDLSDPTRGYLVTIRNNHGTHRKGETEPAKALIFHRVVNPVQRNKESSHTTSGSMHMQGA